METTSIKANSMVGGWSPFGPLNARSKEVFEEAMKGFVGVMYMPTEVSTQVVAGTSYRFRCDAEVVGPRPEKFAAIIEIYHPLQGRPRITRITRIDGEFGGWTSFGPLSPESRAVFDDTTRELDGVRYVPLEVSTQVVAGMNYRFRCEATVVTPDAATSMALIEIFQPLEGPPLLIGIEPL